MPRFWMTARHRPWWAPTMTVYFGIYGNPSNGSRGFMLHFSSDLTVEKLKQKFAEVDCGMLLASAFRSLADESHSMTLLNRYESRLRRIHKQAHAMLLRLRQEHQSEPAPPEPALPEPPPAPAPTPDLA